MAEKKRIHLDWSELIDGRDDGSPPPELVVLPPSFAPSVRDLEVIDSVDPSVTELVEGFSDRSLEEEINKKRDTLERLGNNLRDGGKKLRVMLAAMSREMERRKLRRVDQETDRSVRPRSPHCPTTEGTSDGLRESPPVQAPFQECFAQLFSKKMDENNSYRAPNAHKAEESSEGYLNRSKKKFKGKVSPKKRRKPFQSSRHLSFQDCGSLHFDIVEQNDDNERDNGSLSPYFLRRRGDLFSPRFASRSKDPQISQLKNSPKKRQTVILDVDEDCQAIETTAGEDIVSKCASMKDTRIYYPSRDDPRSVEISYSDVACLDPKCYLTSPIINFYILYLQQKELWLDRGMSDYHFFNTYFYKKLQEAISCKGFEKDASFSKFRRWWKGVNIFQKAYIFIPIHEEQHWSLAIICFPDREDQSGPIVLHLDSLQLHRSKLIFKNIKSFLTEEWNHMKLEVDLSKLSLSHGVWKVLPSKIEEKTISVPQQNNEYDCGLFVLYFVERFMEEAPDRLKKKDLSMFGKQWFRPEEASGLRAKIKRLLLKELVKATEEANHPSKSAPSSGESE
ncbi:hypothetical protein MLD38_038008 [Melastoma candidum]|uniref:Uncharacterized protein n=1 Tax=Melastoma candidum TaxID=119954 RepID=A0ACB9KXT2_9MYRT|nr:hypothetical protein MLD38_038008 [Melastoma candidum]